jgi:hypothetical protein
MNEEIQDAIRKLSKLISIVGLKLKLVSAGKPTVRELADIHETLTYCAQALSEIGEAVVKGDSREKHGL